LVQKEFRITNSSGLHTRPGNDFVKTAKKFSCGITLAKNGKTVDAKSLLKIMKANIVSGDTVLISCTGSDEQQAMENIEILMASLSE